MTDPLRPAVPPEPAPYVASNRQALLILIGLLLIMCGCCLGAASLWVHRDEPLGSGTPVIIVTPSPYPAPGPNGGPPR